MKTLPVYLEGFKLTLVDEITVKIKDQETGEVATDWATKEPLYVVSAFMKAEKVEGAAYTPKGEEIRVTVKAADEDLAEGDMIALVNPTVGTYAQVNKFDGTATAMFTYKADKVVKVSKPRGRSARSAVPADVSELVSA